MVTVIFVLIAGIIIPIILLADVGIAISTIPTIRVKTWSFSPVKNWFNKLPIVLSLYIIALTIYDNYPLASTDLRRGYTPWLALMKYMENDVFSLSYINAYCFYFLIATISVLEFFSWRNFFRKLKN